MSGVDVPPCEHGVNLCLPRAIAATSTALTSTLGRAGHYKKACAYARNTRELSRLFRLVGQQAATV